MSKICLPILMRFYFTASLSLPYIQNLCYFQSPKTKLLISLVKRFDCFSSPAKSIPNKIAEVKVLEKHL